MNLKEGWQAYKLRRELRALLMEDHDMKFPTGKTTGMAVERMVEIGKRVHEIRKELWRIEGRPK
jgi:hypothetical protein